MPEYKGFRADRLREAMKENGVRFEDMADNFSGKNLLLGIIDGKLEPLPNELFIICKVVNCSADYLLGLSDEMY